MRVVRTLAPLVLLTGVLAGCGGGGSSSSSSADTAPAVSSTVQFRLVTARYTQDTSQGQEQLGPPPQKDMVDTMKNYDCSGKPTVVSGQLLECDSSRNVYLLQSPLVSGGIASATPRAIAGGKEWFVKVVLDDAAASTLTQAAKSSPGSDLAVVLDGKVITALIIDTSMQDGSLGITGDYDKTSATALAQQLTA